jgi:hypothetical protein
MTDPDRPDQPDKPRLPDVDPFQWPFSRRRDRPSRRQRIAEEIAANRRGEYVVPTWVLALGLAVMLAVICGFLFFY